MSGDNFIDAVMAIKEDQSLFKPASDVDISNRPPSNVGRHQDRLYGCSVCGKEDIHRTNHIGDIYPKCSYCLQSNGHQYKHDIDWPRHEGISTKLKPGSHIKVEQYYKNKNADVLEAGIFKPASPANLSNRPKTCEGCGKVIGKGKDIICGACNGDFCKDCVLDYKIDYICKECDIELDCERAEAMDSYNESIKEAGIFKAASPENLSNREEVSGMHLAALDDVEDQFMGSETRVTAFALQLTLKEYAVLLKTKDELQIKAGEMFGKERFTDGYPRYFGSLIIEDYGPRNGVILFHYDYGLYGAESRHGKGTFNRNTGEVKLGRGFTTFKWQRKSMTEAGPMFKAASDANLDNRGKELEHYEDVASEFLDEESSVTSQELALNHEEAEFLRKKRSQMYYNISRGRNSGDWADLYIVDYDADTGDIFFKFTYGNDGDGWTEKGEGVFNRNDKKFVFESVCESEGRPADSVASQITDVLVATFPSSWVGDREEVQAYYEDLLKNPTTVCATSVVGGKIVGFITAMPHNDAMVDAVDYKEHDPDMGQDDQRYYVEASAILPEYRGQNLYPKMLADLYSKIRAKGIHKVSRHARVSTGYSDMVKKNHKVTANRTVPKWRYYNYEEPAEYIEADI